MSNSAEAGRFVPLFGGLVSVSRLAFDTAEVDENDMGKVILSRTTVGCKHFVEAAFAIDVDAVFAETVLETL